MQSHLLISYLLAAPAKRWRRRAKLHAWTPDREPLLRLHAVQAERFWLDAAFFITPSQAALWEVLCIAEALRKHRYFKGKRASSFP